MIEQVLAIVRNTFFESIRQPVVFVLLMAATLLLIVGNMTATFTMEDDQKMLIDIGLATVFVFGALLAAFIATNVLTREIDNKTVLTVISKPVGRPLFVIGKFLGVAGAILVASLYMIFVFLLVEMHGVLETVRTPWHAPVLVFGFSALLIALVVSVWCNYFYGRVFSSTMICTLTPLAGLAYVLSLPFSPHFEFQDVERSFDTNLWLASICVIMATLVLTAIAIAISTRAGQLLTICITVAIFLVGLLSDAFVGQQIARYDRIWLERARGMDDVRIVEVERTIEHVTTEVVTKTESVTVANEPLSSYAVGWEQLARTGWATLYAVLPNFQVLWLSDAVTQEIVIPPGHVVRVVIYGCLYIVGALAVATILFQTREVG